MIDRELLELAAKAAGIGEFPHIIGKDSDGDLIYWNPLADDGDALRLAVKLRMLIDTWDTGSTGAEVIAQTLAFSVREDIQNDPYAATRRAIVRAAAEIGKTIQ